MPSVKSRGKSASLENIQCTEEGASVSSVPVNSVLFEKKRREKLLRLIKDAERRVSERKLRIKAGAAAVASTIENLLDVELMRCPKDLLDMNFNDYLKQLKSGVDMHPFDSAKLEAQCKAVVARTPVRKKKVQPRKEATVLDEHTNANSTPSVRRSTRQCTKSQRALRDRQNTDVVAAAAPREGR